jgi:cob(I)alamin adenosyltransferase
MLYTKKGDDGKTNIFGCDQRLSKSSAITEALGCLDEINSYLGIIKTKVNDIKNKELIHRIQNDLFTIQAEVAGADKKIEDEEVKYLEEVINNIEKELPPIFFFLISGANEMSAHFDFARTLSRRAERRVVAVSDEKKTKIDSETLIYLNRLSSLLYALARFYAVKSGPEESPKY